MADPWTQSLIDALVSESGANGEMRRASFYNERIADELALIALEEDDARHRKRVRAHVLAARNLVGLTVPIVVELWRMLPWLERAKIAIMLLMPSSERRVEEPVAASCDEGAGGSPGGHEV